MARTYTVAKARKAQGNCRSCSKAIEAGDPYKWAKPRYRGKVVVCSSCQITQSMTSSSKMVAIWEAQEAFAKVDTDGLADELRSLAETAREVGQEYQEACDNQREYFPDSEMAEENEQKAQELESWADELDSAADEVDSTLSEIEELHTEQAASETIDERLEEIEQELETKEQEARDAASVADECPV